MWKTDPNINISITHTYIHTHREHVFKSGIVRGDWGRRKEENDREQIIYNEMH
jgi:hypothetical protein